MLPKSRSISSAKDVCPIIRMRPAHGLVSRPGLSHSIVRVRTNRRCSHRRRLRWPVVAKANDLTVANTQSLNIRKSELAAVTVHPAYDLEFGDQHFRIVRFVYYQCFVIRKLMSKTFGTFEDRSERRHERVPTFDSSRKTIGRVREFDNDIIGKQGRLVVDVKGKHACTKEVEDIPGSTRGRFKCGTIHGKFLSFCHHDGGVPKPFLNGVYTPFTIYGA